MKTVLIGINSKYIHPNIAIRYLKANCDLDVDLLEFTIKDNLSKIYQTIMDSNPNILAFSVYIWNVEIIKKLLTKIKQNGKNITVILGGPESSYESDIYFFQYNVNYIIINEGEIAFNELLKALSFNYSLKNIPNLKYIENGIIKQNKIIDIVNLNDLRDPYDIDLDNHRHKIAYLELSRGCPFHCTYCLASLDNGVRFFSIDRVKNNIVKLYKKGARTFKFLDRTFNVKEHLAKDLLKYIIDNQFKDAIFQFEVNADILSEDFIDFVNKTCPPNKIRFEIGIQSTNDLVNKAVSRRQNTSKLLHNIRELKKGNIIMHLDLIAGLPYEDFESFKNTFNETFRLYGDELQLGFLKLLKGTKLFYQKKHFNYSIDSKAPYEIIDNKFITKDELEVIHIVEEALNIYWNKGFLNHSIEIITKNVLSPFDFFYGLGKLFLEKNQSFHRYQLTDIFQILEIFVNHNKYIYDIRYDYLKYHKIKPKIYWNNLVPKNKIIRKFHESHSNYNIDSLYKYSVVISDYSGYILAIYYPNKTVFYKIKA